LESGEIFELLKINAPELKVELEEEEAKSGASLTENSTTEKESFDPAKIRNVLLIGSTGKGKSTLANVITDTSEFKESDLAVSETKDAQSRVVAINGYEYRIIDTIGIGDTKLDEKEVLMRIAEAARMVKEGLSQVLFVTSGRFTDSEVEAYNILRTIIFDGDIVRYTTIVRTNFPSFQSPARTEEDERKLRDESGKLADVIANCNKILYVDNPSTNIGDERDATNKKVRENSRKRLLTHLNECVNVYKPSNLDDINERIGKHVDEKQNLANSIDELKKQLDEQKVSFSQERSQLMKELEEKGKASGSDEYREEMKKLLEAFTQERNQLIQELNSSKERSGEVDRQILFELRDQLKNQSEEYLKQIEEMKKQNQSEIEEIKRGYQSHIEKINSDKEKEERVKEREREETRRKHQSQFDEVKKQNEELRRAVQQQAARPKSNCPLS